MSKSSKRRPCPALDREITAAECGEGRISLIRCPADCVFNPFAPAHYAQLLEIEGVLDKKTFQRLVETAPDKESLAAELRVVERMKSGHALHSFMMERLFFRRDAENLNLAERWEAAGFPGLKNDERVLFRAKMRVRVVLLEVRRVLDNEQTEAIDLLETEPRPIIVRDRGLAAQAARFAAFLSWAYPLPHFWRMHGNATVLPDMSPFEPLEIVHEIARHQGAPHDAAGLRTWLALNFVRFEAGLNATSLARRRLMFEAIDAKFGKAVYELRRPFAACRERLDTEQNLAEDDLSEGEKYEGFAEARVWWAKPEQTLVAQPAGGRAVLGRVLLGQSHWRAEAMGQEKLTALREEFERLMGDSVVFNGERLDDLAATLTAKGPKVDESLVPPRLKENPQRIVLSSSRIDAAPLASSQEDVLKATFEAQDRAWLDTALQPLGGLTPRQAARDPAHRPALIRMMKSRVRQCDEHNLAEATDLDVNWMIEELGLEEILLPAPPLYRQPRSSRPVRDMEDDDDGEDDADDDELAGDPTLPPAPPLPDEPLAAAEVQRRCQAALERFDLAEDALVEMTRCGSTLVEDVEDTVNHLLDEDEVAFLIPFLIQIWAAFVPPGHRGPVLDPDRLESGLRNRLDNLMEVLREKRAEEMEECFARTPQPALSMGTAAMLLESINRLPRKSRPKPEKQAIMACMLCAAVEEMDAACREME